MSHIPLFLVEVMLVTGSACVETINSKTTVRTFANFASNLLVSSRVCCTCVC